MTDFPALFKALGDAGVEMIIVGGAAATAHGSARITRDLDVVYARSAGNIERLVGALASLKPYPRGAPPGLPFVWDTRTIRNGSNFTLVTSAGQIDLLGEITGGGDYTALVSHTEEMSVFGVTVRVLDLETLIATKRAAGRPKDFEAIAELELLKDEKPR